MMMTRLLSAIGGCCLFEGEPIDRPQENGKVESITAVAGCSIGFRTQRTVCLICPASARK
jgi:hypothetical protein